MKKFYYLFFVLTFFLAENSLYSQTIWNGEDFTFTKNPGSDWTLEENQDRLTDNVWITRQNAGPIYNYKWWQDNFSTDATKGDLIFDFWNEDWTNTLAQTFTATGGTKRVKWTLLDDTGSSSDWSGYNYGTLGSPENYYSFNNIIQIIEILEDEDSSAGFNTIEVVDDFTVSYNGSNYDSPDVGLYIEGKKFGLWLVEDDIYLTLTFNSWGTGETGTAGSFSYTRSTSPLSVEDVKSQSSLNIYPNPATDYIQISGIPSEKEYKVYSLSGKVVAQGNISDMGQVNIKALPKGTYLMSIEGENVHKFIKQ